MAFAVLSPASSLCPFQERHLSLAEHVKIGCAVEGAVISDTNGIFDCKSLSPDHAAMWYTFTVHMSILSNLIKVRSTRSCQVICEVVQTRSRD